MLSKKVVVISFTFPPASGIGGRRWAKFCKEFHRRGIEFRVITADSNGTNQSQWKDDMEGWKGRVTKVDSTFPVIIRRGPSGFVEKLHYRLLLFWLRLNVSGNHYDHSALWKKKLIPAVSNCLDQGYTHIIATAGPFAYLADLIELKQKFPDVEFIADFRDPWTNNKTSFGFDLLSPQRQVSERSKERNVIRQFDKIVSVADSINNHFKEYVSNEDKFFSISNGYDEDETVATDRIIGIEKLQIIFTGTLYRKVESSFERLVEACKSLSPDQRELIEIHFYGKIGFTLDPSDDLPHDIIRIHNSVSLKEIKQKISQAHVGLLMVTPDLNYSFSTKFFEYIAGDLPILLIGSQGCTSEEIVKNKIGWHAEPNVNEIRFCLQQLIELWQLDKIEFGKEFDKSKFSTIALASNYLALLR